MIVFETLKEAPLSIYPIIPFASDDEIRNHFDIPIKQMASDLRLPVPFKSMIVGLSLKFSPESRQGELIFNMWPSADEQTEIFIDDTGNSNQRRFNTQRAQVLLLEVFAKYGFNEAKSFKETDDIYKGNGLRQEQRLYPSDIPGLVFRRVMTYLAQTNEPTYVQWFVIETFQKEKRNA